MPIIKSLRNIFLKKEEEIVFLTSVILLLAVTPHLIQIINRPWSIEVDLFDDVAKVIWFLDYNGVSKIISLVFGFYFVSILFLLADEKKRTQTIMLILVMLIIIYNIILGNIFSNIKWDVFWIGIGIFIGILASSDNTGSRDILKDILKGKTEYKKPARNLTVVSLLIVLFSFFAYYIELFLYNRNKIGNTDFFEDSLVVIIFTIFVINFMKYEIKSSNLFVLGPKNSGKSLFLAGVYLNALSADGNFQISPSEDLVDLIDEVHRKDWPRRTEMIKEYSFNYRHGKLFPRDTFFYTYDYPGPYLEEIYDFMKEHEIHSNYEDNSLSSLNLFEGITEKKFEIFAKLERKIKHSDKLIFLLDGEMYPYFTSMGIKHYLKILRFLNEEKMLKDYYIVITKCDLLLDLYFNKTSKHEITDDDYEDFKEFINGLLLGNTVIKPLLRETDCQFIYPVFYHTVILEDGSRIPLKDSNNNIQMPYGYVHLMKDLVS